jgi:hypothetical protein
MSSTLESYELIRFAEAFEARLATAGEMLAGRPGLEPEKRWLAEALELVRTSRAPSAGMLERMKDLPELEEAREEYGFHQLGLWVDALEKLHAGITFTASSRAPVIEALFPHLKFPQLRRAPRDAILEYATSFERRTKSSYVTRIFARDDFALVRPVVEQVFAAHAAWRSSHEPSPLTPEVEAFLREELVSLGRKLDVALRQARLLSEAALVPVPSVYEAAGLGIKPKRRAGRGLGPTADEGGFPDEPVDSMEPTEAELAEVAALDAGGVEIASPGPAQDGGVAPVKQADTDGSAQGEAGGAEAQATESVGGEAPPSEAQATGQSSEAPPSDAHATVQSSEAPPSDARSVEPSAEADATGAPSRGARKGRKKADAAPAPDEAEASPPQAPEAQAPRVRKKKAAASGTDTP